MAQPSIDPMTDMVGVLRSYFSAPMARALLTSTLRQANVPYEHMEVRRIPSAVAALEDALPRYIADANRRAQCIRELRALLGLAQQEGTGAPGEPERAPDASVVSMSTNVHVTSPDDVVNACEVMRDIARKVGFSDLDQVKLATATAELTRNALLYAKRGQFRVSTVRTPRSGIEIEVSDEGPGIANIDEVMSEHYRSRTGMGMGLKGTRRLVDTFDITSSPAGTRVVVRKFVK